MTRKLLAVLLMVLVALALMFPKHTQFVAALVGHWLGLWDLNVIV